MNFYAGLPPKYKDSVRAITPGLPLFLYNYTAHQLHGVFEVENMSFYEHGDDSLNHHSHEMKLFWLAKMLVISTQAASFGGSNIDPTAWEDKKCRGESRFPAQVQLWVVEFMHV